MYRCQKCGNKLLPAEFEDYDFYCSYCDKNFYGGDVDNLNDLFIDSFYNGNFEQFKEYAKELDQDTIVNWILTMSHKPEHFRKFTFLLIEAITK